MGNGFNDVQNNNQLVLDDVLNNDQMGSTTFNAATTDNITVDQLEV
jgi:hypothetical protein